jgi:hypothetical protein
VSKEKARGASLFLSALYRLMKAVKILGKKVHPFVFNRSRRVSSFHTMVYQLVLLVLQLFQVLFLWMHDWVPLGRLNDVTAVRNQDSFGRLLVVTLVQSVPWTFGLAGSAWYLGRAHPRGSISGSGSPTACCLLARSAPGGSLICSNPNQNGQNVTGRCSVTPIHFCRRRMGWCQTQPTFCYTSPRLRL